MNKLNYIITDLKTIAMKFLNKISTNYKINSNDLIKILNNISFEINQSCQHKFDKGKNIGELCQNNISPESKTGKYCGKHLLNETNNKKIPAKTKKIQQQAENEMNIIKKLNESKPLITIRRNKFGNYEHEETSLVMDKETKKIIGKQNSDNSISELTAEDIETCKLWKFNYELPSILS